MVFELIDGQFNSREAMDFLTQMVNVKVKFHEEKISCSSDLSDIESRERKIMRLQSSLHELRAALSKQENVEVMATIDLQ